MSLPNNRRRDPGVLPPETILLTILVVGTLVVGLTVYAAVRLGHTIAGTVDGVPADPYDVIFGLINGRVTWPAPATWIMAGLAAVVVTLGVLASIWWGRATARSTRADRAAAYLGAGREIEGLTRRSATAVAQRLRVDGPAPGLPIGVTVRGGVELFTSWEDLRLVFAGPRFGKSTAFVIPSILAAPGAVVSTSNKRDVVDATRDPRSERGKVWVFDPQGLALEEASWWWNPLSFVTDEVRAKQLADLFYTFSRRPDSKEDAYFTPAARSLVRGLLLAAALDDRPITQAFVWATRMSDDEPARILRRHPDYSLVEAEVTGVLSAPDKQRAGVFGGAQQILSALTNSRLREWVEPRGNRPQFDPAAFVSSTDTLYLMSKEGPANAGAIVTALTIAIAEAGEEAATRNGGRLQVPLLFELDELANVCKWEELPNVFSHYGSRGMIIDGYFQNKSQALELWGSGGVEKLVGAANVVIYAGNIKDIGFLRDLSELIGDYDHLSTSVSYGRGGRSVNRQTTRRRIFDVSELTELPKGRALVLAGGNRATIVRTQPWMTGPHAAAVEASITAHDPSAKATLEETALELELVESAEASLIEGDTGDR
ncbi:type IV secretory system conjugative DNA transfer family protein [Antribacter gilvus]|uniref:type IV secretory system conjugative DNA transfer family protein n=1 Tax=Antribacter gilvus TaxID=2304675 RepID=UPI000F7A7265|nr:TraM recognition domain-containing protein [Antribacter gilvus]